MGLFSTFTIGTMTVTRLTVAKVVLVASAVTVGGGSGLASVGALPDPAQRTASSMLEHVGIDVPRPTTTIGSGTSGSIHPEPEGERHPETTAPAPGPAEAVHRDESSHPTEGERDSSGSEAQHRSVDGGHQAAPVGEVHAEANDHSGSDSKTTTTARHSEPIGSPNDGDVGDDHGGSGSSGTGSSGGGSASGSHGGGTSGGHSAGGSDAVPSPTTSASPAAGSTSVSVDGHGSDSGGGSGSHR